MNIHTSMNQHQPLDCLAPISGLINQTKTIITHQQPHCWWIVACCSLVFTTNEVRKPHSPALQPSWDVLFKHLFTAVGCSAGCQALCRRSLMSAIGRLTMLMQQLAVSWFMVVLRAVNGGWLMRGYDTAGCSFHRCMRSWALQIAD